MTTRTKLRAHDVNIQANKQTDTTDVN